MYTVDLPGWVVLASSSKLEQKLMLHSTYGFRKEALAELAGNPKRDHYDLPARIEHPESLGEELVYLPTYVVRAMDAGGRMPGLAGELAKIADAEDE